MDKVLFIDEFTRGSIPAKSEDEVRQDVRETLGLTVGNETVAL